MAGDRILTREQVAEMFRVSPRTVQRWGRTGKLASLRASDVYEFLARASYRTPQAAGRDAGQPE
jgi:Helix-turn-helix domain